MARCSRVSDMRVPPPTPPHVLTPTALSYLECDAKRFFLVEEGMRRAGSINCCCPRLSHGGCAKPRSPRNTWNELVECQYRNRPYMSWTWTVKGSLREPCGQQAVSGFAWSSFVAQSQLLKTCAKAGLSDDIIIACDSPLPSSPSVCFGHLPTM